MTSTTVARVMAELDAREQRGIAKYGVTVTDNPLSRREWLQHAKEEALDLAIYLERLIEEEEKQGAFW